MLTGTNINLWGVEQFDLPLIREWVSDSELVHSAALSLFLSGNAELEQWFRRIQQDPALKVFTIKTKEGQHVGNIELSNLDFRAGSGEVGMFLGEIQSRRKGYGKDALHTLLRFAFEELNLHRVSARVIEPNKIALAFFKECGFAEEGNVKDAYFSKGRYWDIIELGMLSKDFK